MVYRKLEVLVDRDVLPVLDHLTPGLRKVLFEELEEFAGVEDKFLYPQYDIDGVEVFEISVGGFLIAYVHIDCVDNTVYLLDMQIFTL